MNPLQASNRNIKTDFSQVSPIDWEDWSWQMRNRIRNKEGLSQLVSLTSDEKRMIENIQK